MKKDDLEKITKVKEDLNDIKQKIKNDTETIDESFDIMTLLEMAMCTIDNIKKRASSKSDEMINEDSQSIFGKKYEVIEDDNIVFDDIKYFRIRALKDFSDVRKGDFGGYIESEDNLSQEGICWIYDDSKVSGTAHINGSIKVKDETLITGNVSLNVNEGIIEYSLINGDNNSYTSVNITANRMSIIESTINTRATSMLCDNGDINIIITDFLDLNNVDILEQAFINASNIHANHGLITRSSIISDRISLDNCSVYFNSAIKSNILSLKEIDIGNSIINIPIMSIDEQKIYKKHFSNSFRKEIRGVNIYMTNTGDITVKTEKPLKDIEYGDWEKSVNMTICLPINIVES